jgi:hypothetical protein
MYAVSLVPPGDERNLDKLNGHVMYGRGRGTCTNIITLNMN